MMARSLVLAAALALIPAAASAQTDPSTVAVALFHQGRDLMKQNRYPEACPKLAESHRLEPKLGTLLNLAVCNEKLGKVATAWAEYMSAAAMARHEGAAEKEREAFARDQAASLEKKLSHLTLQGGAPSAGLRLTLDDHPFADAVLGTPIPIDPGKHRISASAPGKKAWSMEIDVTAEKAEFVVSVPVLEAEAPPPSPPVVPPQVPPPTLPPVEPPRVPANPEPPPVVPVPAPSSGASTSTVLIATGFGVGGLGVLVGAVTGAVTLANASSIRQSCKNNQCNSDQQGAIDGANTLANASNVAFGIGAAGVVVGVVGLLLRPPAPAPAVKTGIQLTPLLGPGSVGILGRF
jgi:xanthosine utilization system XapX-like protein